MSPADVHIQVCGRQESLRVDNLGLRDVSDAVEKCFEVKPPFLLVDLDGRPLTDDLSLAGCVAQGRPIVVKLTEGVLHDVSRRVDQLRHMQWGFVSDQLSALKREVAQQQQDLRSLQVALHQEQSLRDRSDQELQQRLDQLGHSDKSVCSDEPPPFLQKTICKTSNSFSAPSDVLADVKALQTKCDLELHDLRKQLAELRQLFKRQDCSSELECNFSKSLEEAIATERKARTQQIADLSKHINAHGHEHMCGGESRFATREELSRLAVDANRLQADLSKVRSDVSQGVDILKDALIADLERVEADVAKDIKALRSELMGFQSSSVTSLSNVNASQKELCEAEHAHKS